MFIAISRIVHLRCFLNKRYYTAGRELKFESPAPTTSNLRFNVASAAELRGCGVLNLSFPLSLDHARASGEPQVRSRSRSVRQLKNNPNSNAGVTSCKSGLCPYPCLKKENQIWRRREDVSFHPCGEFIVFAFGKINLITQGNTGVKPAAFVKNTCGK